MSIAQQAYGIPALGLHWYRLSPSRGSTATELGLVRYYPLYVRWKLKDGREFILENIDLRPIMQAYFQTHSIQTQWEKEKRPRDYIGDYGPILGVEVQDDFVRIKWVITTNHTPVHQRLTAKGAATYWHFTEEQFIVATLQGQPTQGQNFEDRNQFKK